MSPNDQHRVILEPYNNNDYINASIARSSSDPVESGQFYILGKNLGYHSRFGPQRIF